MSRSTQLAAMLAAAAVAFGSVAHGATVNVTDALVDDVGGVCPGPLGDEVCTVSGGTASGPFEFTSGQNLSIDSLADAKSIVIAGGEAASAAFVFNYAGSLSVDQDAFSSSTLTLGGVDPAAYAVSFQVLTGSGSTFTASYSISTSTEVVFDDFDLENFDLSIVSPGFGGRAVEWDRTTFSPASVAAVTTPEPAPILLLGAALVGLAGLRRRHSALG